MPRTSRAEYPSGQPPVRRALRREIIGLLCIKLAALTLLYWAFFGPSARPHLTTPDLTAHILSPAAAQTD